MAGIYFVYGLAFLGTGLLLAFQSRLPVRVLPRSQLALLAAFAIVHGTFEWTKLAALVGAAPRLPWAAIDPTLLVASFAFLMQFGLEVLVDVAGLPRWTRAIPLSLVAVLVVLAIAGGDLMTGEAAVRYVFGLPGAWLTALAFLAVDGDRKRRLAKRGPYMRLAVGSFAVYGVVAGVVVPAASGSPAWAIHADSFHAVIGVHIELVRAASALFVAVALSEAFVIESAREHAAWERQREEFISVVAHDLRSPIGAIVMGTAALEELVERDGPFDRARARLVLQHLKSSGTRLERSTSDLLDTSRIEARRLAIAPARLELRSFVGGVVDRASPVTRDHAVATLLPETLPAVAADPARLEQILVNLLSNAAKYSTPASEIRLEAAARDAEVEIAVTNAGPGLTKEEAARVFTRFYRTERHRATTAGSGLGLYIAKGLVEAHDGRMWVESEPGALTRFAFTLPAWRGAAKEARGRGSARPAEA